MFLSLRVTCASYAIFHLVGITKTQNQTLSVICPAFEYQNLTIKPSSNVKPIIKYKSTTDYCICTLNIIGSGKTAIVKCDFEFKETILLTEEVFSFKKWGVSSAYVRMTNAKGAIVSSRFLSSLMDAPSSAVDLWHCGQVIVEPTPELDPTQQFADFKTFIGAGIIDCTLTELPPYFLRDRSRGALRLKDCNVGKLKASLLHNIDEVRYMIIEDTRVKEVESPLASTGIILSKKEIHSWDGMELINTTFEHVASNAFNISHKDESEKFSVKNCHFGKLNKKAISVSGDINVNISSSSFAQMDSMAIQVSVNGTLFFSSNTIEMAESDSFLGLSCKQNSTLINNTIHVPPSKSNSGQMHLFRNECGNPKVSYVVMALKSEGMSRTATSAVILVILVITAVTTGLSCWGWRNRMLFKFHYKRNDTPLYSEERTPDGEEDVTSKECSTTIQNPTFDPQINN